MILENLHKGCEELRSGQTSERRGSAGISDDEEPLNLARTMMLAFG
jgi:hypothetical protein